MNRLLRRDGQIEESWRIRLDSLFGTTQWFDLFYQTTIDLFGQESTKKIANFEVIGQFYNERLKTAFPGVASNPRSLYNSRGNPLYLLCFAASNPKGVRLALKIAQYILAK